MLLKLSYQMNSTTFELNALAKVSYLEDQKPHYPISLVQYKVRNRDDYMSTVKTSKDL